MRDEGAATNYEEAEANANGIQWVRAGCRLRDAARVRAQLRKYLDLPLRSAGLAMQEKLRQINADTAALQNEMWLAIQTPALNQPTPVMALVVSGMSDVLDSQGYTQAAWWTRIPILAWGLLVYYSRRLQRLGRIR